jgi:hypothetical protein
MVFFWDIDHDRAAPITIGLVHNREFGRTALFQQVTWKSPIFLTCDLLNTWIASGVGCNRTLQSFFSKYASASGALVQLLAWERPTGAPQNWRHLLRAPTCSIGDFGQALNRALRESVVHHIIRQQPVLWRSSGWAAHSFAAAE